jgi:hypothetical protein
MSISPTFYARLFRRKVLREAFLHWFPLLFARVRSLKIFIREYQNRYFKPSSIKVKFTKKSSFHLLFAFRSPQIVKTANNEGRLYLHYSFKLFGAMILARIRSQKVGEIDLMIFKPFLCMNFFFQILT